MLRTHLVTVRRAHFLGYIILVVAVRCGWAWHRFFLRQRENKTSIAIAVGSIGFVAVAVVVSIASQLARDMLEFLLTTASS